MTMKKLIIILFFAACISCCKQNDMTNESINVQQVDTVIRLSKDVPEKPVYMEEGINLKDKKLVPDKETAFNIAVAVLSNIYGDDVLRAESPFNVYLRDSVWVIYGTQKYQKGGFAYIEINSIDGKVLKVAHEE